MIFSVVGLQWGRERCNCVRNHYRISILFVVTCYDSRRLRTSPNHQEVSLRSFFVLRTISKMSLGHEVVVLPRTARLVVAFLLASVLTYACLWLPEVSIPSMFRLVRTHARAPNELRLHLHLDNLFFILQSYPILSIHPIMIRSNVFNS